MFTQKDTNQIHRHGLTEMLVERQIQQFNTGFPFLDISRPAVKGDGITTLNEDEMSAYASYYMTMRRNLRIEKFVPASGAATRMFKELFEYLDGKPAGENIRELLDRLDDLPFGNDTRKLCDDPSEGKKIIATILGEAGLNYGQSPKGLILFHRYDDRNRTALEEHLTEGAQYAAGKDNTVNIHFTVSPEHQSGFETLVESVLPEYEKQYQVTYRITYSRQDPGTDTIAVTPDNQPFRDADGQLVFRPAGHGALLQNLERIDADLIFIKNIDNVCPDHLKADTVTYKNVLAGLLLEIREQCFAFLQLLDADPEDKENLSCIRFFIETRLGQKLPADYDILTAIQKAEMLGNYLNRPIRVCGMVRNEGEPGGGPYWVRKADGSDSLQIAEAAQIAPEQQHLMAEATHFNPVDLVCSTVDYRGNKFALQHHTDPQTGFISVKSKDGRELKALELPGLWNGAMADWNTIFVEVPVSTFTPVKVVNDLLRPEHQPANK